MTKNLSVTALLIFVLSFTPVFSGLRNDLADRTSQEVLEKSYALAESNILSKVTGALWVNGKELGTAIALDPYTLLTCAHFEGFADLSQSQMTFRLHKNAQANPFKTPYYYEVIKDKPVLHPTWKKDSILKTDIVFSGNSMTGEIYMGSYRLKDLQNVTYDEYIRFGETTGMHKPITGVDLAIVKLKTPLPAGLVYPEILEDEYVVKDTYGVSLGYGDLTFNDQEKGPVPVSTDPQTQNIRHLLSVKVSAKDQGVVKILHGNYRGILIHGNDSFIPTPMMMKTEGLPVKGDSGGPFLIKSGDTYKLAGIFSGIHALNDEPCTDPDELRVLGGYTQPIFPVFVDIRPYKEWIKKYMGKL